MGARLMAEYWPLALPFGIIAVLLLIAYWEKR
jgi:hypothetical protein